MEQRQRMGGGMRGSAGHLFNAAGRCLTQERTGRLRYNVYFVSWTLLFFPFVILTFKCFFFFFIFHQRAPSGFHFRLHFRFLSVTFIYLNSFTVFLYFFYLPWIRLSSQVPSPVSFLCPYYLLFIFLPFSYFPFSNDVIFLSPLFFDNLCLL